jgi:hypothetical protein
MLFSRGDLLAPEEAPPDDVRVETGDLLVGHSNGVLSVFERPTLSRRIVVRSACGSAVTASARSPSRRFVAIATHRGVTVVDLVGNCWAFRAIEKAREVTVSDDGTCTAITVDGACRFDGMEPETAETAVSATTTMIERGDFAVDVNDRSMQFGGTVLGPSLPDASILSPRGVLVTRRNTMPRWFDFATHMSRVIDVGNEIVGGLALSDGMAAVGTWSQTVCVTSLCDGTGYREKAIRKADLVGDYLPAFVLTPTGEVVVTQRMHDLLSLEAVVWFGPRGRRRRMKLPQLGLTLTTLLSADDDSVLLHIERRKGLWVFRQGEETQLVPSVDARWVPALHDRHAFVLQTRGGEHVLAAHDRVVQLEHEEGDRLDRAAFSPSGEWLAVRWSLWQPRQARIELWHVGRTEQVSRFDVQRVDGAIGWATPGCVDLAVDDEGGIVTAIAPSVYGFFDRTGGRVREVAVLPDGEWLERTADSWAHSAGAFCWGGLRYRGRVLDLGEATVVLGPPRG